MHLVTRLKPAWQMSAQTTGPETDFLCIPEQASAPAFQYDTNQYEHYDNQLGDQISLLYGLQNRVRHTC